jgi:hypothetical protein
MTIPVPMIIHGRILGQFKKAGAIGYDNAMILAELYMDKWPFSALAAKRIFVSCRTAAQYKMTETNIIKQNKQKDRAVSVVFLL